MKKSPPVFGSTSIAKPKKYWRVNSADVSARCDEACMTPARAWNWLNQAMGPAVVP